MNYFYNFPIERNLEHLLNLFTLPNRNGEQISLFAGMGVVVKLIATIQARNVLIARKITFHEIEETAPPMLSFKGAVTSWNIFMDEGRMNTKEMLSDPRRARNGDVGIKLSIYDCDLTGELVFRAIRFDRIREFAQKLFLNGNNTEGLDAVQF